MLAISAPNDHLLEWMPNVGRTVEEIWKASGGDPERLADGLKLVLVAEFEPAFSYLKTQKGLSRLRSSAWIGLVRNNLEEWLEDAPLKGKQKSQVRRHIEICRAVQELLEDIDRESSSLRIWDAPTDSLLKSLFAWIERRRFERDTEEKGGFRKLSSEEPITPLKQMEAGRRGLRSYCDYVGRIVNQISLRDHKKTGDAELSDEDITNALAMAAVSDLVLHVLNCYSYKDFRVSIQDKRIELHGLRSRLEEASMWSSLRDGSRSLIDVYDPGSQIRDVEASAREMTCDCVSFHDFLACPTGEKIFKALERPSRKLNRVLRRDVEELIDLNFRLRAQAGVFRADELLDMWSLLYQLALSAYMWRNVLGKASPPLLPLRVLIERASFVVGCKEDIAASLVSQFTLDPAKRNQDPFFRPLIKLEDEQRLIAGTYIETGRIARNLFTIAIREGGVDFSAKGLKPLRELREEFTQAGFVSSINLPITGPRGIVTDADIVATKDGYLFLGQTKVMIHPDTVYDEWKALENLKAAARQLDRCLDYTSFVARALGLSEGEYITVPFLLTNVWNFTGATVQGFKVVDFSYLSLLLRGAEVWQVRFGPRPTRTLDKLIAGKYPTGAELSHLIHKSWHEGMFQKPKLGGLSFTFGDWSVTLPIDASSGEPTETRG